MHSYHNAKNGAVNIIASYMYSYRNAKNGAVNIIVSKNGAVNNIAFYMYSYHNAQNKRETPTKSDAINIIAFYK